MNLKGRLIYLAILTLGIGCSHQSKNSLGRSVSSEKIQCEGKVEVEDLSFDVSLFISNHEASSISFLNRNFKELTTTLEPTDFTSGGFLFSSIGVKTLGRVSVKLISYKKQPVAHVRIVDSDLSSELVEFELPCN